MHAVLKENLEGYLSGAMEPAERRAIESHLGGCDSCRQAAMAIREVSGILSSLRSEELLEPSGGFYAAVMQSVEARRESRGWSGVFALDFTLARRLVLTSAMAVVILGGFLVGRETSSPQGPLPVALMAEQESPAFESAPGPEAMLATLTAYVR